MGALFHELYKKRFGWPPNWRVCVIVALCAATLGIVITVDSGFKFDSAASIVAVVAAAIQGFRSRAAEVHRRRQAGRR